MSSNEKRETGSKNKYTFFSDPDVIAKRAESAAAAIHAKQGYQNSLQQDQFKGETQENPKNSLHGTDFNNLDSLLTCHPIQPHPFTFITAVKRKLALGIYPETCKKAYEPRQQEKANVNTDAVNVNTDYKESIQQVAQKMDFIKPLKVPDVKISPKSLDYSSRDNSSLRESSQHKTHTSLKKFETLSKEMTPPRGDKITKTIDRVQRKLDFTVSEGTSVVSCKNIEPLKTPEFSVSSSITKKKDHARDSSREKENRSKRIKKDDSSCSKTEETLQDTPKKLRNSKHMPKKDGAVSIFKMLKNENYLSHIPKESDSTVKKAKSRNFATSTTKKDDDKRHKVWNVQSSKSARDKSADSRSKSCSNDCVLDQVIKSQEKNIDRDSLKGMVSENTEHKYKENYHLSNIMKQADDQKHKGSDIRPSKQHSKLSTQSQQKPIDGTSKEHSKRISERPKSTAGKIEQKYMNTSSEISEDIESVFNSNTSLRNRSTASKSENINNGCFLHTETSSQQSKIKEPEKSLCNTQISTDPSKSNRSTEDMNYIENSSEQSNVTNIPKNEDASFHSVINSNTNQTNTNGESHNSFDGSFSEVIMDPRKISFRDDSYTQQEEFCDLVTPNVNLMLPSKRKKQLLQGNDTEADVRNIKHKSSLNMETTDAGIQLLHPAALHMQFQAELHLLDSFNESLRQVMDVEKCLHNVKHEQEKELLQKQKQTNETKKQLIVPQANKDTIDTECHTSRSKIESDAAALRNSHKNNLDDAGAGDIRIPKKINDLQTTDSDGLMDRAAQSQRIAEEFDETLKKQSKSLVKVVEVQTQTVNDIATQTDVHFRRHNLPDRFREFSGITYERGPSIPCEIPHLSLESLDQVEELDQIEDVSLPSKLRTMSEISMHETTSSIKTETGTEISISTRGVTCSFNKYLDLEMAQLIKDEKQRYDKIEMLFKSREKTLNDRTRKLVKLEEQKRALRDTGQDSRISSVKKKQRALLLKLQQEKDEMNRLKELHKMASQERKLMLQKQRNMFNPQMSTKNILTKLKRSADSQSPRRLSGPMKGYDIRSNSSMSSLVDSDKSQVDRSQMGMKSQVSDTSSHKLERKFMRSDLDTSMQEKLDRSNADKFDQMIEESIAYASKSDKSDDFGEIDGKQQKCYSRTQKGDAKSKYELKSRKYEDKMPKPDVLCLKSHRFDINSTNSMHGKSVNVDSQCNLHIDVHSNDFLNLVPHNTDKSICEYVKSESDTLIEELSRKSKSSITTAENNGQGIKPSRDREQCMKNSFPDTGIMKGDSDTAEESKLKKLKSSQIAENDNTLLTASKTSKKNEKSVLIEKDNFKKTHNSETKPSSKRKGSRSQKAKLSSDVLEENVLRTKSSSHFSEEIVKHHGKRSKMEKESAQALKDDENLILEGLDFNDSHSSLQALLKHSRAVKENNYKLLRDIANEHETNDNISGKNFSEKSFENFENGSRREDGDLPNLGNISTRSQVSTFTISHHSSADSEKSYSRSVVIRAQDHQFKTSKKLEQILGARETALASRRNCVEKWIAWHARLRAEESRIARMEEAAYKLVSATSNALSYHDTTVSSDTSDVEGRVELLTENLAERRLEMARLKKEARKQAKQRLRALETNLLNQIKKYDTTIHEMRKKLETKKEAVKDNNSEKLAIESMSLADFKVPKISTKRIQEIYRSSDLLRSRSESDLLSEEGREKTRKNSYSAEYDEKREESGSQKSTRSLDNRNIIVSEASNSEKKDTSHSNQSLFEEVNTRASATSENNSIINSCKRAPEPVECEKYKSTQTARSDAVENFNSCSGAPSDFEEVSAKTNSWFSGQSSRYDSRRTPCTVPDSSQNNALESVYSQIGIPIQNSSRPQTISVNNTAQNNSNDTAVVPSKSDQLQITSNSEEGGYQLEARTQQMLDIATLVDELSSKSISSQSGVEEVPASQTEHPSFGKEISKIAYSSKISSVVDDIVKPDEPSNDMQTVSHKLNILELNNKNLNDDISTLENDLKALSEMMSRFSKTSDEKVKSGASLKSADPVITTAEDTEKNTSKDVSEVSLKLDSYDTVKKSESIIDMVDQPISQRSDSVSKEIFSDINTKDKTHIEPTIHSDLISKVTEDVFKKDNAENNLVPDAENEFDFEARSKQILNEIEKSIISEHIKSSDNELNVTSILPIENIDLSNAAESLKDSVKSTFSTISEITEVKSNIEEAGRSVSDTDEGKSGVAYKKYNATDAVVEDLNKKAHKFDIDNRNDQPCTTCIKDSTPISEPAPGDNLIRGTEKFISEIPEESVTIYSHKGAGDSATHSYIVSNEDEFLKADYSEVLHHGSAKVGSEVPLSLSPKSLKEDELGKVVQEVTEAVQDSSEYSQGVKSEKTIEEEQEDINLIKTSQNPNELNLATAEKSLLVTEHDAIGYEQCEKNPDDSLEFNTKLNYDDEDSISSKQSNEFDEVYVKSRDASIIKSPMDQDWTTSDSFEIQQIIDVPTEYDCEKSELSQLNVTLENTGIDKSTSKGIFLDKNADYSSYYADSETLTDNIDESVLLPKYESTKIEDLDINLDEWNIKKDVSKDANELHHALSLIAQEESHKEDTKDVENKESLDDIPLSVTRILNKVESEVEKNLKYEKDNMCTKKVQSSENLEDATRVKENISESDSVLQKPHEEDLQNNILKNRETSEINTESALQNLKIEKEEQWDVSTNSDVLKHASSLPLISISLSVEIQDSDGTQQKSYKSHDIVIEELEPGTLESEELPELEIDAKIELPDTEELPYTSGLILENILEENEERSVDQAERDEAIVVTEEQSESPTCNQLKNSNEQLDNLIETIEDKLDVIKKIALPGDSNLMKSEFEQLSPLKSITSNELQNEVIGEQVKKEETISFTKDMHKIVETAQHDSASELQKLTYSENAGKTFEIIKDPEYEDISEESLEVSEILDRSESQKSSIGSQKSETIPEKYEVTQKSDEVLRILDEISQKSVASSTELLQKPQEHLENVDVVIHVFESITPEFEGASNRGDVLLEKSKKDSFSKDFKVNRVVSDSVPVIKLSDAEDSQIRPTKLTDLPVQESEVPLKSQELSEKLENVSPRRDVDASSESSEGVDTPRGVSEIEMDSPRNLNESRLDVDALDDDLLGNDLVNTNADTKAELHVAPIVTTSEKDIEAMINKLKASLEQPGLDVAELEAKLLRIEQLQIELEIKKLEAEEVSYYVREIPNKPPPPYTPPGGGRSPTLQVSPSPPAVVPTNIEELTAITEKATAIIFKAKQSGQDIMNLEAATEIFELSKEDNETAKKDRKIYNAFLFDLCKETIAEVYRSEYEKPGPSWSKLNAKTKVTIKIPKTVDELNEYVNKEVATLFGFKTKLQRENMVMRWSRKRRDRVDELLAREAQAEEDEWTKFHRDELTVKNELTVAILDSLILETANVIKSAYIKKRQIST
ncbi:centrosome-associated protein 350 isoform X2 [Cephus cinctus]|uniref:Centrosome-associated protein 350 isoform X2 n=1 Tax=Cephus cinctus TaxID=211228 RepID=A0AAJ7RHW4_CEPCN|nr:centrosome-associated protein 350 isoform X2 [Cephus cinctus]